MSRLWSFSNIFEQWLLCLNPLASNDYSLTITMKLQSCLEIEMPRKGDIFITVVTVSTMWGERSGRWKLFLQKLKRELTSRWVAACPACRIPQRSSKAVWVFSHFKQLSKLDFMASVYMLGNILQHFVGPSHERRDVEGRWSQGSDGRAELTWRRNILEN